MDLVGGRANAGVTTSPFLSRYVLVGSVVGTGVGVGVLRFMGAAASASPSIEGVDGVGV